MSFSEPRLPVTPATGLGAYFAPGPSSFTDFVTAHAPHLQPVHVPEGLPPGVAAQHSASVAVPPKPVHGTPIVPLTCSCGGVVVGYRRATQGNLILQRDIETVFVTDSYSAVGI